MKIPRKAEKYFPNASTIEVFTNMTTRHYRDIQVVFLCNDHDLQFCLRKKYVSLSQGEKINLSFSSSANDVHIYIAAAYLYDRNIYILDPIHQPFSLQLPTATNNNVEGQPIGFCNRHPNVNGNNLHATADCRESSFA